MEDGSLVTERYTSCRGRGRSEGFYRRCADRSRAHVSVAEAQEGKRQGVVARKDGERAGERLPQPADAVRRPARLFDRDDVRLGPGELGHRLDGDLDAAAPGNAVEDDGELHRVGDGGEVGHQAGLRAGVRLFARVPGVLCCLVFFP